MIYGLKQHFTGGGSFHPPPGPQARKNIPGPIGLRDWMTNTGIIQLTEEFEFPAKTVFANNSMIIDLRLRF